MTVIGSELALRWPGGQEDYIPLETLRRQCPCASCQGERDIMGNLHKPPTRPYGPGAFELKQGDFVGGYGYQPRWMDGHSTGIYSWDYLKRIADGK